MALYQKFREFWRTVGWLREQSALWAERHYPAEMRHAATGVMFCLLFILAEDSNQLTPSSVFHEEIKMPDLLDVELMMAIEQEFALSIPQRDGIAIRTIGELIDYVHKRSQHVASVAE
jgi:acyl carrier protein